MVVRPQVAVEGTAGCLHEQNPVLLGAKVYMSSCASHLATVLCIAKRCQATLLPAPLPSAQDLSAPTPKPFYMPPVPDGLACPAGPGWEAALEGLAVKWTVQGAPAASALKR